ncbi:hypothetical protein EOL70_26350 [Leucothrix sargassi]|nr:hypothetical protein EOL70_26350 [Leucothrix sargassi]
MTVSESQFEEDFKLVFALSKKAKRLSTQQMVERIKQHSMAAARENQVVFKITSFSQSSTSIGKTLNYNSRKGDLTMFDNMDNQIQSLYEDSGFKYFISEVNDLNKGRHKTKRLTMNFILSLSEGTPKKEFQEATSNFLNTHFGEQPYLYTFHDDTEHYHAHVVAGLRNYQGERVITSKDQLMQWRQGFAKSLRDQGILAEATPATSRGQLSQNTELRSKDRMRQRGEILDGSKKHRNLKSIDHSIEKRKQAWVRMHDFLKYKQIDTAEVLKKYITNTYYHENLSLEQDLSL